MLPRKFKLMTRLSGNSKCGSRKLKATHIGIVMTMKMR